MIILTPEEANQVRGLTVDGHALAPVPLSDGSFALPDECLNDPAHVKHHDLLKALPKRAVAQEEYLRSKAGSEDDWSRLTVKEAELLHASRFKSEWEVGKPVIIAAATDLAPDRRAG